jgi:hypothetical protein
MQRHLNASTQQSSAALTQQCSGSNVASTQRCLNVTMQRHLNEPNNVAVSQFFNSTMQQRLNAASPQCFNPIIQRRLNVMAPEPSNVSIQRRLNPATLPPVVPQCNNAAPPLFH